MGNGLWVKDSGFRKDSSMFKVQSSKLINGKSINGMKVRCIPYIDLIISNLPEIRGGRGFRENYLVVSAVKRAAEGEI